MNIIDGPTAPPLEITISREEYDNIKRDVAELFDCHNLLREASAILGNKAVSSSERQDFEMRLAHFIRDHTR